MADTAAAIPVGGMLHVDATIPVAPDKLVLTIPLGIMSVICEEDFAHLEYSLDGTIWATLSLTEGRVLWSSRRAMGDTIYLRLSSGSPSTHPLLGRDHL
jgi:hypothetical protein